DFDYPDPVVGIPLLGPLIAQARHAGLIADDETERLHTFRLYGDWKGSANWRRSEPLSGLSIILGNYVAGRKTEYLKWYEAVRGSGPTVSRMPAICPCIPARPTKPGAEKVARRSSSESNTRIPRSRRCQKSLSSRVPARAWVVRWRGASRPTVNRSCCWPAP